MYIVDGAKIFVADKNNKRIYVTDVANMDDLSHLQFEELLSEDMLVPDLIFHRTEQKLYYIDTESDRKVYKCNADGTDPEMVMTPKYSGK